MDIYTKGGICTFTHIETHGTLTQVHADGYWHTWTFTYKDTHMEPHTQKQAHGHSYTSKHTWICTHMDTHTQGHRCRHPQARTLNGIQIQGHKWTFTHKDLHNVHTNVSI